MQLVPLIHPRLHNINLRNIIHSLITQNPREWMFIVPISLLIVTFLSHISQFFFLSLMQNTKEVNPHLRSAPCFNMWSHWSVTLLFILSVLLLLLMPQVECWVHAYATSHGKVNWSGLHQPRWEENEFKFHSVTCYTTSIVSHIHVNTTKLCHITCTLGVILQSLECRLVVIFDTTLTQH